MSAGTGCPMPQMRERVASGEIPRCLVVALRPLRLRLRQARRRAGAGPESQRGL